jgi:hypothetical protein
LWPTSASPSCPWPAFSASTSLTESVTIVQGCKLREYWYKQSKDRLVATRCRCLLS